ncbi:MAG: hypothetical protein ACK5MJ_00655 [Alphaproteobacteria bacterium]
MEPLAASIMVALIIIIVFVFLRLIFKGLKKSVFLIILLAVAVFMAWPFIQQFLG